MRRQNPATEPVVNNQRQKTRRRRIITVIVVGVTLVNALAWMQAHTMLHYVASDQAMPTIEQMSVGQKLKAVVFGIPVSRPSNHVTPANIGLDFQTIMLETERGQRELWQIDRDQARGTVVMVHGYAASKASLLDQARIFHEFGWRTILVDFHGSGGSSGNTTTLGVREADDVRAVLNHVKHKFPDQPLVVYGFSMGAAAVVHALATYHIQVDGVIVEAMFDRLLATTRRRFGAMGLPSFPMSELLIFWGSVDQGINGFGLKPIEDVRAIQAPVLMLRGEHDPRVTDAETRAIAANLQHGTLAIMPNTAHTSGAISAPSVWRETVQQFLQPMQ